MRIYIVILLINIFIFEVNSQSINLADPTIFKDNEVYYLYGTGAKDGFEVYLSTDLINWRKSIANKNGMALSKENVYGTKGFWAPQIFKYKHLYYMIYTANEFIAIAHAEHPEGPFIQEKKNKLPSDIKFIDPYVFVDDDDKIYLYHVRLDKGNCIFVAEMEPDLARIKTETLTGCIFATEPWENTADSEWPVCEGPTVIKINKKYYLFYSANDFRNKDYAVGYAVSDSPYGPWIKYKNNPIISKINIGCNGTGHGDIFLNDDNDLCYVFHTHFSDSIVAPRKTAMVKLKSDSLDCNTVYFFILPDTFYFLK